MRALPLAALLAVLALPACDASSHASSAPAPMPSAAPPSSARTPPPRARSPLVVARPYEMHVPKTHAARAPLLVFLHGYGGDHSAITRHFGVIALSDAQGFFLALPDGTQNAHGKRFWNASDACCDFDHVPVDDVAYLDAVIDDALATYPIDPTRVYMAGHSNGGFMAHRYACDRADRVAAIASLAGAAWKDASLCKPKVPVSVLQVHGDADYTVLYGGLATSGGNRLLHEPYPGAKETVAMWGRLDGCGAPTTTDEGRDELVQYAGCAGGAAVELWTMHHMRHGLPLTPDDMRRAWTFLSAHAR